MMRTHRTTDTAVRHRGHSAGRVREAILDFFSPTVTCDACGADSKLHRCERTGEVHGHPEGEPITRWSAVEVEVICPACGAPTWFVDRSSQYPYPVF